MLGSVTKINTTYAHTKTSTTLTFAPTKIRATTRHQSDERRAVAVPLTRSITACVSTQTDHVCGTYVRALPGADDLGFGCDNPPGPGPRETKQTVHRRPSKRSGQNPPPPRRGWTIRTDPILFLGTGRLQEGDRDSIGTGVSQMDGPEVYGSFPELWVPLRLHGSPGSPDHYYYGLTPLNLHPRAPSFLDPNRPVGEVSLVDWTSRHS